MRVMLDDAAELNGTPFHPGSALATMGILPYKYNFMSDANFGAILRLL
jgi:hypothetical protein